MLYVVRVPFDSAIDLDGETWTSLGVTADAVLIGITRKSFDDRPLPVPADPTTLRADVEAARTASEAPASTEPA